MDRWFSKSLRELRELIVFSDITVISLIFVALTWLRFKSEWHVIADSKESIFLLICLPITWIVSLTLVNAWETSSVESKRILSNRVVSASWRTLVFMGFLAHMTRDSILVVWLITQVGYATVLMIFFRLLTHHFAWERNRAELIEKYMILTLPGSNFDISKIPPRDDVAKGKIQFEKMEVPQDGDYHPWLITLKKVLVEGNFDGLIIEQNSVRDPNLLNELSHFYQHGISAIIMQSSVSNLSSRIKALPHANWIRIVEPHLSHNGAIVKRATDVIGSLFFLILLSPVMLVTAVAIKLTSKGPIFYSAKRVGQNNELFWFPKFRSMYQNADEKRLEILGRPDEKMVDRYANDPRITPVGRFIRRWSIDELPQFICVLLGTMSLVGPRPILPEELEQIDSNHQYRFIAKPGLTGIWQVSGRKEVIWQERMAQDTYYIESWSLISDFYLIGKTCFAIINGRGSF